MYRSEWLFKFKHNNEWARSFRGGGEESSFPGLNRIILIRVLVLLLLSF